MNRGIGGHHSPRSKTDVWLTPPKILKALGPFDLDPCCPISMPWQTAERCYTPTDDGLACPWFGRVWLNPPYGTQTDRWLRKLMLHGRGTALIFARTETRMFFEYGWKAATAMLFIEGRLHFHDIAGRRTNTNAGAPSVLLAYGNDDTERLRTSGIAGAFVEGWTLLNQKVKP